MFDRNSWRQAALPCLNPYGGLTAFVKWIDDVRKESQEIILMAHNNKFFSFRYFGIQFDEIRHFFT